jgi:hypothetical protein
MRQHFLDYYRCPDSFVDFETAQALSRESGFFLWGQDTVCYGRTISGPVAGTADSASFNIETKIGTSGSLPSLPCDPEEVVENLQRERYAAHFREPGRLSHEVLRKMYYSLRPCLSVQARKQLQRIYLRKWREIPFPEWPVDYTVDRIHRKRMALAIRAQKGIDQAPFIWFWPDGYMSCAIITHDVESPFGLNFSPQLMDLDESFGFRSSFQIVPEARYSVSAEYLKQITDRGFEVNVHDLKHDGRLFANFEEFLRRAKLINTYEREFGASGFRSGILYRNADWYDAFDFLYDMSIPNVAHLDPQRGGCCTVMPFFIGNIIELPLTCTQDYTLFHVLRDFSIDLWKRQIGLIRANFGLVSVLAHPDYLGELRERKIYKQLLQHLADLRDTAQMWTALPGELARWWQQRSQMRLASDGHGHWHIEGEGSQRARIAYACAAKDTVSYSLLEESVSVPAGR